MIGREFLAEPHKGVRVSAYEMLAACAFQLEKAGEKGYGFPLGELKGNLCEMATRFYKGDVTAVDEFLQLYSLDEHRPKMDGNGADGLEMPAILNTPAAKPDTRPITIPAGL